MFTLYNLLRIEDSDVFITQLNLVYFLCYTEYTLEGCEGMNVRLFGFDYQPGEAASEYDFRIHATIIFSLHRFFNHFPNAAVMYLCAPGDNRGRQRQTLFNRWFQISGRDFEKHSSEEAMSKEGIFMSLLVRAENPHKQHFVRAFYHELESCWGG